MSVELYVSLALLGLAAVDVAGIAAMPLLLSQAKPYRRALLFLGGSFLSLVVMGLLFARGFGAAVLHFEEQRAWLVPTVEAAAGSVLLGIGLYLWRQLRHGQLKAEPSHAMLRRLQMGDGALFGFGAALVAVQSVVDVVFVVAMVHAGQLYLSNVALLAAVMDYALAALVLQLAVVVTYRLTPPARRAKSMQAVQRILTKYANQTLIAVSLALGVILLAGAVWGV